MTWLRDMVVLLALQLLRMCIQNHEGDYGLETIEQVIDFCDFGLGLVKAMKIRRGLSEIQA